MFNQIAKEINDEIKHNGWSYKDLIWIFLVAVLECQYRMY